MTTKRYPSYSGTSAVLSFRLRYLVLLLAIICSYTGSLQAQCTFEELYGVLEYSKTGTYCPPITTVTGDINDSDPTFSRPDPDGACSLTGDYYYETRTFRVDQADTYTFNMSSNSGDYFFALYKGGFLPDSPCSFLLAANDDGGVETVPRIVEFLQPGINYTMVTTTYGEEEEVGAYSYNISSANGGLVDCNASDAAPRLLESIPLGLGPNVDVSSNVLINICFTGDLDNELLMVNIAGQNFTVGDLGYIPGDLDEGPYCRDFVIENEALVEADIADGEDLNIEVTPIGSFWSVSGPFGFSVTEIMFDFEVDNLVFEMPDPSVSYPPLMG
jgi:hypothetical protein